MLSCRYLPADICLSNTTKPKSSQQYQKGLRMSQLSIFKNLIMGFLKDQSQIAFWVSNTLKRLKIKT